MRILIILCALLMSSCLGGEFQRKKIAGNYFLITTDNYIKDIYIGYKLETGDFVGVLPSKIIEVGKNEDFIIAKQSKNDNNSEVDYYIVKKMSNTIVPDSGVLGPFSKQNFERKLQELGLKGLKFKKVL